MINAMGAGTPYRKNTSNILTIKKGFTAIDVMINALPINIAAPKFATAKFKLQKKKALSISEDNQKAHLSLAGFFNWIIFYA